LKLTYPLFDGNKNDRPKNDCGIKFISFCQKIVNEKQMQRISYVGYDGKTNSSHIDLTTASMIVSLYNMLSEDKRVRMLKFDPLEMISVGWKVISASKS
jgi:hypothetical protein